MTQTPWLDAWIALVADLPRELPESERFRRLLRAVRETFPWRDVEPSAEQSAGHRRPEPRHHGPQLPPG